MRLIWSLLFAQSYEKKSIDYLTRRKNLWTPIPILRRDRSRRVERVLAPVSTKPTENRPRPTYAAVTRKYRAPVQKFHLNQENRCVENG
ncbi:hypothetical protein TNCV_4856641 [Trichonephila clavipes]|nr:hypothetical protein TNCV_4856641 [Trichonephila clavipes]